MEKLVYALWKGSSDSPTGASGKGAAFRQRLRGDVASALRAEGARGLRISVVDGEVAAGAKLRLDGFQGFGAAKDALVSFWLEQSQERAACEAVLAAVSAWCAGYLVVESRPLVDPEARKGSPQGERSRGFVLCTCIEARDGISHDRFLERWYGVQRDCAIETQSTFSYVRNEVVRPLTEGAPRWAAIVEEGFPIGALDDPAVFYDAVGDPAKLAAHQRRMFESCRDFLALDRVDSHPMSEYVFEGR